MKNPQRPTPDADLERKHRLCWWWRSIGTPDWDGIAGGGWPVAFKSWYERSAFLYELNARLNGKFEFQKPWTFIGRDKHDILARRWPHDDSLRIASTSGADNPPEGFTAYMGREAFNLRLPNDTLAKTFLSFIERERRRLKIPNPPRNKGQNRRGLSWRPIELLDIKRLQLRPLEDGERSQLSKLLRSRASI